MGGVRVNIDEAAIRASGDALVSGKQPACECGRQADPRSATGASGDRVGSVQFSPPGSVTFVGQSKKPQPCFAVRIPLFTPTAW